MAISPIVRKGDPLPISNSSGKLMNGPANPGPKRMYMDRILGRQSSLPVMNLGKQPSQRNQLTSMPSPIIEEEVVDGEARVRVVKVKKKKKSYMTPQQSLANMLGKARAMEVEAGAHKRRF